MPFGDTFRNKDILVTGNTGFKGSWLTIWLQKCGANVFGLSDGVPTTPSFFEDAGLCGLVNQHWANVSDKAAVEEVLRQVKPDFIFHLAAQPIVSESFSNPYDTVLTNAIGTLNLLESVRVVGRDCILVIITSDKVYNNKEWVWGYKESDELGGKDPYSASKGMAELVIKTYVSSFFNSKNPNIRVGVGRAGNVIGGADWSLNRIVPDCIRAWTIGVPVLIRNPKSTRPWQHVLEPLSGYLALAQNLIDNPNLHGEAFNFGPPGSQNCTVLELIEEMHSFWKHGSWKLSEDTKTNGSEANLLKLNCDKALAMLDWKPVLNFSETAKFTADWYKVHSTQGSADILKFSKAQIDLYEEKGRLYNLQWTN